MRNFCFIPSECRKKQKGLPVSRAWLPPSRRARSSGEAAMPESTHSMVMEIDPWQYISRRNRISSDAGAPVLTGSDPDKSGRSAENHVPAGSSAGHNGRRHGKILFLPQYRRISTVTLPVPFSLSHVFKGFDQQFVKVPVDQIKFVHKISIKGLSGQTAVFCDLTDGDGIYRGVTHTLLHGFCQSVFCFLTPCEGRRFVW